MPGPGTLERSENGLSFVVTPQLPLRISRFFRTPPTSPILKSENGGGKNQLFLHQPLSRLGSQWVKQWPGAYVRRATNLFGKALGGYFTAFTTPSDRSTPSTF
jgi:hypothetical protein